VALFPLVSNFSIFCSRRLPFVFIALSVPIPPPPILFPSHKVPLVCSLLPFLLRPYHLISFHIAASLEEEKILVFVSFIRPTGGFFSVRQKSCFFVLPVSRYPYPLSNPIPPPLPSSLPPHHRSLFSRLSLPATCQ